MKKLLLCLIALCFLQSCSGIRQSKDGSMFVTHAESFRIFGHPIPKDDQAAAMALVPQGAQITTIHSTQADWTSLVGILNNIFGYNMTTVGGTK